LAVACCQEEVTILGLLLKGAKSRLKHPAAPGPFNYYALHLVRADDEQVYGSGTGEGQPRQDRVEGANMLYASPRARRKRTMRFHRSSRSSASINSWR
jgi:hypothetical protein